MTGIHPNLENPFTVPGISAVVAMTTVHFISGGFEMVCEIRDPKCYVILCATFQTGVSCCRELEVINCRGTADTLGARASSPFTLLLSSQGQDVGCNCYAAGCG